ncbi:outer membrane beta-barrel protein [soil metagenome]
MMGAPTVLPRDGRRGNRAGRQRALRGAALLALGFGMANVPAHGQVICDSLIVQPAIPACFDRGRNVSVMDRGRPDYQPLGIDISSFKLFPRLGISGGTTDNVFLNATPVSDGFVNVTPEVDLNSDWSRHELRLTGSAALRRFFNNPIRNQNPFNLAGLGRLDVSSKLFVTAEAQYAEQYETPDTGAISANLAVLSTFKRSFLSLRGEYRSGQGRFIMAVDRSHLKFADIPLVNGGSVFQGDRDRTLVRVTPLAEYAFTPSISVFGQLGYTDTSYDQPLATGTPNRDSKMYRGIGGLSFDLAGLMRGRIGVGYSQRNYRSAVYRDIGAFSAEGQLEYFPSELTTIALTASRTVEDSSIRSTGAYFDSRVGLRVDHELLRNLLIDVYGNLAWQDYIDTNSDATNYAVGGIVQYLSNRFLTVEGQVAYSHRSSSALGVLPYGELRGQVGITLKR